MDTKQIGSRNAVNHTPGPWKLQPVNKPQATAFDTYAEGSDCSSLSGTIVAGNEVVARVPIEGTAGFSKLIHYRDAQLIAATPDLLEALQRSLNWLSSYPGEGAMGCYDQARAAIAKATGGA